MAVAPTAQIASSKILWAFANVRLPIDLLSAVQAELSHSANGFEDEAATNLESREHPSLFEPSAWHPDSDEEDPFDSPMQQYQSYLASAMLRTVRSGHDEGNLADELTLRHHVGHYIQFQWQQLTEEQNTAVAVFLRRMALLDVLEVPNLWAASYWSYWYRFDSERLPGHYKDLEYKEEPTADWITQQTDWEDHPRFGNKPRLTGLNPVEFREAVFVWHAKNCRIPNTAIRATPGTQIGSCYEITHYFDHGMHCVDCGKAFIFFAEEQKYWYETLKIPVSVQCIRCIACRKVYKHSATLRQRYEELVTSSIRSTDEELELANIGLTLFEEGVIQGKALDKIRSVLNRLEGSLNEQQLKEWTLLKTRSRQIAAS